MADASSSAHRLLFVASLGLGVPVLALCGLTVPGPPSPETIVFTVATLAFVIGGLMAPWQRVGAYVAQIAFVLMLGVIGWRFFAAHGTTIRETTGPGGTPGRAVDRLLPERDVAIGGSSLLLAMDAVPAGEAGLLDALRDGYDRMRQAEGPVASPVLGTFLFGQRPTSHALLRVAPVGRFERPEAVLVFLHGFIGNVTLPCWQVAQAAIPVGMDAVCPSTEWDGRWEEPDGVQTIQATLTELRGQGVRRIYLAGLSQGAIALSEVAASLEIEGLVLISGASSTPRVAEVPTLVLQGARDRMTPPAPARAYAEAAGARYEEHPEAGHWLVLSEHEWVEARLRRWLAEREGQGVVDASPDETETR